MVGRDGWTLGPAGALRQTPHSAYIRIHVVHRVAASPARRTLTTNYHDRHSHALMRCGPDHNVQCSDGIAHDPEPPIGN